jgi:chromosome segregation ATPase
MRGDALAQNRRVDVWLTLDSALKERLRAVLDQQPVTEAELRNLSEEGQACVLILGAELERSEQTLAELASDPTSSLRDIAAAFRRVNELRPNLDELQTLLARLHVQAREFRASWLSRP